ncbi:hypothetical protein MMC11_004260 [Xylographa trunciseda]|nr:hypothetical protein [Xylographa trunciseda]
MFQKATQTMIIAPASTQTIYVPDESRTSCSSSSQSRSSSPSRSLAAPHTLACSPVELHKARIESTFRTIEYIDFRDKPVCLIVIDVRFIYNKKYQMRSANIEIAFHRDPDSSAEDASYPRTTDTYGPTEYFGDAESIPNTQNVSLKTPGKLAGCELPTATIGSSNVRTQSQKWQIQGTRQLSKTGPSQRYNWTVFDNDLSSFESFPRAVTLWMIVEHNNAPFYAEMHMDGKLRGHMTTNMVSRFGSYYQDKKEVSKTLAPEGLVPELTFDASIEAAHNIWNCLAAKRRVEGRIFVPTVPSARKSARFDEVKLRAALASGIWNEDIMNDTKDDSSEIEEDTKSVHIHLSCDLKRSLFGIKRKTIAGF